MDQATREIHDLWAAVFGEPPSVLMDHSTMIAILVEMLPSPTHEG